jgi:hypothetical protein
MPDSGPPPARPHTGGNKPGPVEDRIAEWEFFRGLGWDRADIAARLGLCERTLQRYEQRAADLAVA